MEVFYIKTEDVRNCDISRIKHLPNTLHGNGNYLVCRINEKGEPDLSDIWVVNGLVFPEYYDTDDIANEAA